MRILGILDPTELKSVFISRKKTRKFYKIVNNQKWQFSVFFVRFLFR